MTETTTIILAIVGTGVTVGGVLVTMGRMLNATITREFNATNKRIDDAKTDLNERIDGLKTDLNTRIDDLKSDLSKRMDETNSRVDETNQELRALRAETQQGFENVHRDLGEQRERMAKLEGSLDGFLAGRRDRDAA